MDNEDTTESIGVIPNVQVSIPIKTQGKDKEKSNGSVQVKRKSFKTVTARTSKV